MRKILIATAAVFAAAFGVAAASAEPMHAPGGPIVEGKLCWVSTQGDWGMGYWQTCPKPAKAMKRKKM